MGESAVNFRVALGRRVRWLDGALLAAPVLATLAVFALPKPVKLQLALQYEHPTLLTLFTSSYVHFAPEHLLGNLLAYLFVAPLVYLLCVHRRFEADATGLDPRGS